MEACGVVDQDFMQEAASQFVEAIERRWRNIEDFQGNSSRLPHNMKAENIHH